MSWICMAKLRLQYWFFFFSIFTRQPEIHVLKVYSFLQIFNQGTASHTTQHFFSSASNYTAAVHQASVPCIQCNAYNAMWVTVSSGKHHCQTVRFVCFILSRCFRFLKINYKSKQHDSLSTEQIVLPSFCRMHPVQGSRQTRILMAKAQVKKMYLHNEIVR